MAQAKLGTETDSSSESPSEVTIHDTNDGITVSIPTDFPSAKRYRFFLPLFILGFLWVALALPSFVHYAFDDTLPMYERIHNGLLAALSPFSIAYLLPFFLWRMYGTETVSLTANALRVERKVWGVGPVKRRPLNRVQNVFLERTTRLFWAVSSRKPNSNTKFSWKRLLRPSLMAVGFTCDGKRNYFAINLDTETAESIVRLIHERYPQTRPS